MAENRQTTRLRRKRMTWVGTAASVAASLLVAAAAPAAELSAAEVRGLEIYPAGRSPNARPGRRCMTRSRARCCSLLLVTGIAAATGASEPFLVPDIGDYGTGSHPSSFGTTRICQLES